MIEGQFFWDTAPQHFRFGAKVCKGPDLIRVVLSMLSLPIAMIRRGARAQANGALSHG